MRILPVLGLLVVATLAATLGAQAQTLEPSGPHNLVVSHNPANDTLQVVETFSLENTGNGTFNGTVEAYADAAAMGVRMAVANSSAPTDGGGLWTPTNAGSADGFILWTIDLAERDVQVGPGDKLTITTHYYLPPGAERWGLKLAYDAPQFVLTVLPEEGMMPETQGVELERSPPGASRAVWFTPSERSTSLAAGHEIHIAFVEDPDHAPAGGDAPGIPGWVEWALAGVIGAALMYMLAKGGYVPVGAPRRSGGASAPRAESREALDARKRVLMAGLKELELARKQQEVSAEVYEPLKAEYKKQAVRVMRELSEDAESRRR